MEDGAGSQWQCISYSGGLFCKSRESVCLWLLVDLADGKRTVNDGRCKSRGRRRLLNFCAAVDHQENPLFTFVDKNSLEGFCARFGATRS